MVNFNDLMITSLETITAFDVMGKQFKWVLDELQSATIANSEEQTDITGKQGRLLNTLKRNKAVTVSGANGLLSGGMMATQTGGTFEHKTTTVKYPDYLIVTGDAAATTHKAVGTMGNEIEAIYVRNVDGTLGAVLTQDAEASEGKFVYDPETKAIEFFAGELADGTEIVVYYDRQIEADVLDNMSDQYSEKVALYIDGFAEDKCNNVYRIQFFIPKADFNGNFNIELGDSQTVHNFEARSLVTAGCGIAGGQAGLLWSYSVFGEDAPDVE